ncbi:hypothetical protein RHGRI_003525 [Rhododendron griersonianum]|uniref:Fungal lipase-type domain-containing protein n=1 Tax=Rhododendron griersonianum TaxID=479676 RepID=A0AAV6L7Z1_9ERIC|nr:hypothetical protein RHGRI_003525 [Rhododendron griersonianum]
MALSVSNISLTFKKDQHSAFFSQNPITTPDLNRKWASLGISRSNNTTRMPTISRVTSRNESTLDMSELGRGRRNENKDEVPIPEIPERRLADSWKEIHGQDDWVGMLDPMDPLLRSELVRYGEMAQACYDAFNSDPYSKYCGSCKTEPINFFQYLGWTQYGYEVTRYLHASYNINLPFLFKKSLRPDGWTPSANWMGYVAVSNDETSAYLGRRDITIAWRGTVTKLEWIADVTDFLRSIALHKIPSPDPRVKAESGFIHVYTDKDINCKFCKYSAREQILAEIKRLIKKYEDEDLSITITGHSLGSALAIINAYDIAETGADVMDNGRAVPICVYSFSGPRVGNARFKERLEGLGVKVLRVFDVHDRVPSVPGVFFNEQVPAVLQKIGEVSPWCYSHVGVELALDHKNSPFLKETSDLACFHNLEALLHLVDG